MVDCAICLSTEHGTESETLLCGHVFHVHCIEPWKEMKNTCPLCRRVGVALPKDLETLVNEINTMSGFHIFYPDKYSDEVYHKLQRIKHQLRQYRTIRNKGYSADHLATEIGYLVNDVNSNFVSFFTP